jgi:hypothetical protein
MTIDRYTFDNPLESTTVEKLGLDAYTCTWPPGAPYKEVTIEMIVVSLDAEGVKMVEDNGSSPYTMALANFTGTSKEPESVNKTLFFEGTSARRVYQAKIPRENTLNTFSKKLDDGSFVFVAVRSFQSPDPKVGDLISAIANSFKVKE